MTRMVIRSASLIAVLLFTANAHALNSLQLDILGGTYDNTTQTIIGGTTGTLYAYGVTPNGSGLAIDDTLTYYISAAIVPQGTTLVDNFGSFELNGVTYDASNMFYGFPPLETVATQLMDPNDLPSHGVFETSFAEMSFMFGGATRGCVDTQINTGTDPTTNPGNCLFYEGFSYDASGLNEGFHVHFDLYSTVIRDCANTSNPNCVVGDIDVNDFAPFSHDAESNGDDCCTNMPEPTTLGMALIGIMGVGASRRLRKKLAFS